VISSYTDFVGIEVSNSYTTDFHRYTKDTMLYFKGTNPPYARPQDEPGITSGAMAKGFVFNRRPGYIPYPRLQFRIPQLSPTRAATAIGLLTKYL